MTATRAAGGRAAAGTWPAIAAWGGGLIQIALGAGLITGAEAGLAIRVAAAGLVVLGAAAIGWGAATLARGRIVVPRLSVGGCLAGTVTMVAAMALDPVRVTVFAVAAAIALQIAAGLGCAVALRVASRPPRSKATGSRGSRLVELIVGAALVAALVTPALAATEAAQLAAGRTGQVVRTDFGHDH